VGAWDGDGVGASRGRPVLLEAARLRLLEVVAPLDDDGRALTARVWEEARRAQPALFDGPVAAAGGLYAPGPDVLEVRWVRTTYHRYLPQRVPGATCWLPHLYVSVIQPTEDGALVLGRMADWTSSPGTWQLPSGTAEPPDQQAAPLTLASPRALAARELLEETGTRTAPERLALWRICYGPHRDIGLLFRAPALPADSLRASHIALLAAHRAVGIRSEFEALALARGPDELSGLGGPLADHLTSVLRAFQGDTAWAPGG
jgi:8-oxo-dGTP pyrophosphatase MutT (NUDIX family)